MKYLYRSILCFLFLLVSSCSQELSQASPKKGIYNPNTVEMLQGTVLKVEFISMSSGRGQGVHILLQTNEETIPVHLGPDWYLSSQNLTIQNGDQVKVTGSRVYLNNQEIIVASKISKGEQTVTLRNETGIPLWSGSQRRSP